jgi:AAA15 family ATPase/GTPase
MLIEFSVTNFLSFSEKQTLSMVADKAKELEETHTFQPIGKVKLPRLLHAVGIYGANASGKSNLLQAMKVMRDVVLSSAKDSQAGEPIKPIMPHALFKDKPTEFEVVFIVNEVRYQYGFAATRQRITEEWLFAFPMGRSQQWLSRVYDVDSEEYHWLINATQVKGEKELWKKSTRDNALYLSTAVQLNSEQFTSILEWFRQNLRVIGTTDKISPFKTFDLCKSSTGKEKVLQFMNAADISINDIELTEKSLEDFLSKAPFSAARKRFLQKLMDKGDEGLQIPTEIKFLHQTSEGRSFQLPLHRESTGTRRLFGNAGVWLDVLEQGRVICIDELESSLHPLLTRYIISLFHNSEVNRNHAQLIFTTHDTTILDNELLRRDQIWFVEKDTDQTTQLYPLSDFSPRKDEALQKGYLQGRYGALPYISSPNWLK